MPCTPSPNVHVVHPRHPAPPASRAFPTRRSSDLGPALVHLADPVGVGDAHVGQELLAEVPDRRAHPRRRPDRSEEHTSELQSPCNLVCRLLLEKKKNKDLLRSEPQ